MAPESCDTFVVMGDLTKGGHHIFGKNSDRPNGEVQEVIYTKGCNYPPGTKLKVTYIEIDQVPTTYSVVLSKPSWMWGAEMGANEYGVCVGNEAVWSSIDATTDEKLLGMDLLRLALERSRSAREAVSTITNLLEMHGQGGPCSDTDTDMCYHSSFLIVDKEEAWVLETVDKMWVADIVTKGYRNISNCLTIGAKFELMSDGLKEAALERGLWDGKKQFNFRKLFSDADDDRERLECGQNLLQKLSASNSFSVKSMFEVLRSPPIARSIDSGFPSTGSMVSEIANETSGVPDCHWFTGTPDPRCSVFKPFIFTDNATISKFIQSPVISEEDDPAKVKPRFKKSIDRSHTLYRQHAASIRTGTPELQATLRSLEDQCVTEMESFMSGYTKERLSEVEDLFKDCVDSELKFYQSKTA